MVYLPDCDHCNLLPISGNCFQVSRGHKKRCYGMHVWMPGRCDVLIILQIF